MPMARPHAIKCVSIVLFAVAACGQQPVEQALDRTLRFTHTQSGQDLQEIANAVRGVAGIRDLSIDLAQRAFILRGTADQIALAEWVVNELDEAGGRQPSSQQIPGSANRQFRVPGGGGDLVQIFYLRHTESDLDLLETNGAIRGTGDIRWAFTCHS